MLQEWRTATSAIVEPKLKAYMCHPKHHLRHCYLCFTYDHMQYKEKIAHNKKQNVPQSWSLRDHLSLECRHVYLLVESLFCGVGVIQHMVFIDFELFWWCIWCLFDVFLDLVQHEFFYWKLWQTLTYIYTNSCQQIWMNQSNIYHIVDKQE